MGALLLTSRWLFLDAGHRLEGGGVLVARDRIERIFPDRPALARFARRTGARILDLGERVLAPGFVDAHAHLELTALEGQLPRRGSFADWIRALVAARKRLSPADLRRSSIAGAGRLLAGGSTCVGDIDSSGSSERALRRTPIRARVYREVLDAGDPTRTALVLARAARPHGSRARSPRVHPGLSPHAPYTVSPDLLRAAGDLAQRRRWPVCMHWAETEEEIEWLTEGRGPLRALLDRPGRSRGVPQQDGLEALAKTGLLSPQLALVHGNHPARGDIERIVRAGATLVHCPGTHAFFHREPFPVRKWLDAGARVALGTDGLSSNLDLDMRREMALLREGHPAISAEAVFEMATRAGARALGFEGSAGAISLGAWADLCAHSFPELSGRELGSSKALLDALTRGRSKVDGVWIGGRRALAEPEFLRALSESPRRIAE